MDIDGLLAPALQTLMVFCRVGALWMFFPVFGHSSVPPFVRLCGGLVLSLALVPVIGGSLPAWSLTQLPSNAEMLSFVLREFVIGASMGLVARWMYTSASSAAQWAGMQMGFAVGGLFNPETGANDSAWADFHGLLAMMIFLGVGGHWLLIHAVKDSYQIDTSLVWASLTDVSRGTQWWAHVGQEFFMWMLKLSGPVIASVFFLQAALGVLSKFVPQINVWIISLPLTIGIGVFVFAMLSPMYGDALRGLFESSHSINLMFLKYLGAR